MGEVGGFRGICKVERGSFEWVVEIVGMVCVYYLGEVFIRRILKWWFECLWVERGLVVWMYCFVYCLF